jgi:hypothetical protein
MKYRFILLSTFILVSACFFGQQVFSQSLDLSELIDPNTGLPTGVIEQVSIEQNPQIPKPGEIVSVRLTSYSTDLNKAKITWSQDGKVVLSQTGAVTNQIQAPESGKSTTITITIQKEGGGTLIKTIVLSPADVDLIYEAQTYAHPFFKGKRQYTSESVVNVIAVPNFIGKNGQKIPASNLVYTWSINGTIKQDLSGYGKNTFKIKGELIERAAQISVDVSAVNSSLIATQSIMLKSTTPELVIYENNPVLGVIYEKAVLGSFSLERPQVDFEAIPYFFSGNSKDDFDFVYKWAINGVQVTNKSLNENYLLLQNNKNMEGRATISATLSHAKNILQTTRASLELNFKKVENTPNENSTL